MTCEYVNVENIFLGKAEPDSAACYNDQGLCIDISVTSCDGLLKSGYCPGAIEYIVLCTKPERCFGSGPPLLPSSYEFTLKNQGFELVLIN